jgi:hypothetical protein
MAIPILTCECGKAIEKKCIAGLYVFSATTLKRDLRPGFKLETISCDEIKGIQQGKHHSNMLFIIDEADEVLEEMGRFKRWAKWVIEKF